MGRGKADHPAAPRRGAVTALELLAAAAAHHVDVTARQLKRWRTAGLVQQPTRRYGAGRAGSQSVYPAEAVEQLVLVARTLEGDRNLTHALINLWWDGHWVEPTALRRTLAGVFEEMAADIERLLTQSADPLDAAEALVDDLKQSHHPDPLFSLMRRRLGRNWDDMIAVISTLMQLAAGEEPPWYDGEGGPGGEPSLAKLFERAVGVERAQSDELPEGRRLLPDEIETPAEMQTLALAGAFDPRQMASRITTATQDELELARSDGHMLERLCIIASAAEAMGGRDTGGLGTLSQFAAGAPGQRAQLTSMALVLRQLLPAELLAEHTEAAAGAIGPARNVLAIAEAGPELLAYIGSDGPERLAALSPPERKAVAARVERALVQHRQAEGKSEPAVAADADAAYGLRMGLFDRLRSRSPIEASNPPRTDPRPGPPPSPPPPLPPAARANAASPKLTSSPLHLADIPLRDLTFCIIDVETTGLSPTGDRVVEVGAVRCSADGRVLNELHTLVDPEGPVGPTSIHGIDQQMVAGAPRFFELAPELLALIDGAVLVAHNAAFDMGFLRAEMARSGALVDQFPYICTMAFRRQVGLPGPRAHKLQWACWQEGVAIDEAHAAVCDARATGALLSRYVTFANECGRRSLSDLTAQGRSADSWLSSPLRSAPGNGHPPVRFRPRTGPRPSPGTLHRQQPAPAEVLRAYELALAAAAADFEIDPYEVDELHSLVTDLGMTSHQVRSVHEAHVQRLLDDRLADGVLTWAEQQEVRGFARLLGMADERVLSLFEQAASIATVEGHGSLIEGTLGAGISVCFTGEFVVMPLTREEVSALAQDAGMAVGPGVTKKLDLLVCADPHAGTSKLRKAADYGTVVVDQATFLGLAGVQPAPEGVIRSVLERIEERRLARAGAAAQKQQQAAAQARERARARAHERKTTGTSEQVLWCQLGGHEWRRPPQRGRPPKVCPEHLTSAKTPR
jgi:DNA polymerase-3 subunit epsilon